MGVIIYVDGSVLINEPGNKETELIEVLKYAETIKNTWGNPAFVRYGYELNIASDTIEGSDPYIDGVLDPLKKVVEKAKELGVFVTGDFSVISDCSDFDNISLRIRNNEFIYGNSEIIGATDDELIAELKSRGYTIYKDGESIIS